MEAFFIEDEVEAVGRGTGRSWLSEETTERESGGGWGRNSFHGNGRGREMLQRTFESDRRDENWSTPTHMEGRNDIRQGSQGVPPAPSPLRFTDWSSLGSPHMRNSPHGAPNREIEPGASQPDQWTTQSGSVPHREEAARDHSQEDVIIPPWN